MELDLRGRHVLITGGSRGIGAGIARAFVREGCTISAMGRTESDLDALKSRLGAACSVFPGDATDPAAAVAVAAEIAGNGGALDVLVTCVGSGVSVAPGCETASEWHRVLAVNLLSTTNVVEACLPLLRRSAPSAIVCISSICGCEAFGAPVTYSAAKAALAMAVKAWSRTFARSGVRINVVSPGNVLTEHGAWARKLAENRGVVESMLESEVPLGRFGTADEIADAVLFLASPRASFITGANLVADGGQTRCL